MDSMDPIWKSLHGGAIMTKWHKGPFFLPWRKLSWLSSQCRKGTNNQILHLILQCTPALSHWGKSKWMQPAKNTEHCSAPRTMKAKCLQALQCSILLTLTSMLKQHTWAVSLDLHFFCKNLALPQLAPQTRLSCRGPGVCYSLLLIDK